MADQQIRRRRPKNKGRRQQSGERPLSNRGPSPEKLKVIEASPHLKAPGQHYRRVLPEHLEGRVFLKFTNKTENHNGFQWRTGMNKDILPFRPKEECGPGGLFFCGIEQVGTWADAGCHWVRRVHPQLDLVGKEVVALSGKWKAHRVVADPRRSLQDYRTWEWLKGLEQDHAAADHPYRDGGVSQALAGFILSRSEGAPLLARSLMEHTGGSLQDAIKHLRREMCWADHRLGVLARKHKNLVSPADWRACQAVYPSLGLGRVSVPQVVAHLWRSVLRIVKPTKKVGANEQE